MKIGKGKDESRMIFRAAIIKMHWEPTDVPKIVYSELSIPIKRPILSIFLKDLRRRYRV